MFERFTSEARDTVVCARANAQRLQHGWIGTEHLLLGLLDRPQTVSARLLAAHGLDRAHAEAAIEGLLASRPAAGDLDADALQAIGIDLSAIRERVEAAFGPGALDRDPRRCRGERMASWRDIPFCRRAKKALELSLRESQRLKHKHIEDGHILLGLLREGDGLAARIIADAGIDFATLRRQLEASMPRSRAVS